MRSKHGQILAWRTKTGLGFQTPGACTVKLYGFVIYEKQPNFVAS